MLLVAMQWPTPNTLATSHTMKMSTTMTMMRGLIEAACTTMVTMTMKMKENDR